MTSPDPRYPMAFYTNYHRQWASERNPIFQEALLIDVTVNEVGVILNFRVIKHARASFCSEILHVFPHVCSEQFNTHWVNKKQNAHKGHNKKQGPIAWIDGEPPINICLYWVGNFQHFSTWGTRWQEAGLIAGVTIHFSKKRVTPDGETAAKRSRQKETRRRRPAVHF